MNAYKLSSQDLWYFMRYEELHLKRVIIHCYIIDNNFQDTN